MPQAQGTSAKQPVIEPLEPKLAIVEMLQVVENKKRNLEKRKQKLEALKSKTDEDLTDQQKEAVTHIGEVNGNIMYLDEIMVRFREIQQQVDKWVAIETKKEKLANKSKNKKPAATKNGDAAAHAAAIKRESDGSGNDVQNDGSAEITPRGSVCDAIAGRQPTAAVAEEHANDKQAADAEAPVHAHSNDDAAPSTASKDADQDAAVAAPQELEGGEIEPTGDDEALPTETRTYVNKNLTATANEADAQAGDAAQQQGGVQHGGADNWQYGPRRGGPHRGGPHRGGPYRGGGGGGGYQQNWQPRGPPRGPRGGPYRGGPGPRYPPRSAPSGDPAHAPRGQPAKQAPAAPANNQANTNEFRGG